METVKINNNQNIVEKHFNYTDLFNILFTPIQVNKRIQSKNNVMEDTILLNYAFFAFVPYLTIDNLPADFEDYRYIYINAPMINTLTDKPFCFSFSNNTKIKSLFSGCGTNANIIVESSGRISGTDFSESYTCTNNVLTNTFDIPIDKQNIIPYDLRTSRKIYMQVPSFLIATSTNNIKNTIMPKAMLNINQRDIASEKSIFDTIYYNTDSSQLPYTYTTTEENNIIVDEGVTLSDSVYNSGRGVLKTPLATSLYKEAYKSSVEPDGHSTAIINQIINGHIKELSPKTYNEFINYINSPLENTSYNGIDKNKFDCFLSIPNKDWSITPPVLLNDYLKSNMLTTIFQNKDFYKGKKFSIYFSKDPMGI